MISEEPNKFHEKHTKLVKPVVEESVPILNGLILSGGKSSRMKFDKGSLEYHRKNQREHLYEMLLNVCIETYVSCNSEQAKNLSGSSNFLEDTFLHLGPLGGILSAFRFNPNAAWLTVACDLPFLSSDTLQYLIQHRNPSKSATAFYNAGGEMPEPLITIWEPKSYLGLLHFLGLGNSCPRKFLMNADAELITAPNVNELKNVNTPEEYRQALQQLKQEQTSNNILTALN